MLMVKLKVKPHLQLQVLTSSKDQEFKVEDMIDMTIMEDNKIISMEIISIIQANVRNVVHVLEAFFVVVVFWTV
jgi:hypothetical protein